MYSYKFRTGLTTPSNMFPIIVKTVLNSLDSGDSDFVIKKSLKDYVAPKEVGPMLNVIKHYRKLGNDLISTLSPKYTYLSDLLYHRYNKLSMEEVPESASNMIIGYGRTVVTANLKCLLDIENLGSVEKWMDSIMAAIDGNADLPSPRFSDRQVAVGRNHKSNEAKFITRKLFTSTDEVCWAGEIDVATLHKETGYESYSSSNNTFIKLNTFGMCEASNRTIATVSMDNLFGSTGMVTLINILTFMSDKGYKVKIDMDE